MAIIYNGESRCRVFNREKLKGDRCRSAKLYPDGHAILCHSSLAVFKEKCSFYNVKADSVVNLTYVFDTR